MFRDTMTGNPVLALFEAMLMILAAWRAAVRPCSCRSWREACPRPGMGARRPPALAGEELRERFIRRPFYAADSPAPE
jgi:hypothetical protein